MYHKWLSTSLVLMIRHLGLLLKVKFLIIFFYKLILYYNRNLFFFIKFFWQIVINMFFRANTFIKKLNEPTVRLSQTRLSHCRRRRRRLCERKRTMLLLPATTAAATAASASYCCFGAAVARYRCCRSFCCFGEKLLLRPPHAAT